MNRQTNFVNLFLEGNSLSLSHLKNNLRFLDESQLLHSVTEKSETLDIVSVINAKLHSAGDSRLKALLLLEKFLSQCPTEVFLDYSAGWMQQCCKWNQRTINDELRILNNLIHKSNCNPDLKKQIGLNVLPRFVELLGNIDESRDSTQIVILKLKCIKTFIECYSSSCGPHKGIFHKYVMFCLNEYESHNDVIHEAASCFVSLCECGTKGQQNINFKEAWSTKFKSLVATCHQLFDLIYKNVNHVELVSVQCPGNIIEGLLNLESCSEITPLGRFNEYKIKFSVLAELLNAMLLCKFTVCKSFQPNDIFNLLCRILSVTGNVLDKCVQTNDIIALKANLPNLHETTFEILNSLIICAQQNLIPCGALICKLCLQSLKWTQSADWTYGLNKPFASLKCKVYSVLSSWLEVSETSSFVEVFADDLIPVVTSDIEYLKPSVKLTVTNVSKNYKKNKRKRGQLVTEMNMQSESNVLIDDTANNSVCASAHKALQLIIRCTSTLIKWEHHKNIQYIVLPILLEIFDSQTHKKYPLPYSDAECRLQLFKTLVTLINHPHPKWTAPISLALRILTLGTRDTAMKVASFCKLSVSQVEVMVHPRCSTLYFPVETMEKVTPMKDSDWFPLNIQPNVDTTTFMEVEMGTTEKFETVSEQSEISSGQKAVTSDETTKEKSPTVLMEANNAISLVEQKNVMVSEKDSNNATVKDVAQVAGENYSKAPLIQFPSRFSSSDNKTISQIVSVADVFESHSPHDEPPVKKKEIIIQESADDDKLQTMLSDFVDTLQESRLIRQ